jgi:hypothetical protein
MALATPDGTCELQIPQDRYDPLAVLAIVKKWEREDPIAKPQASVNLHEALAKP